MYGWVAYAVIAGSDSRMLTANLWQGLSVPRNAPRTRGPLPPLSSRASRSANRRSTASFRRSTSLGLRALSRTTYPYTSRWYRCAGVSGGNGRRKVAADIGQAVPFR